MADTCAKLYAELAGLKAEVAALKRVDENRIIKTAVNQAVNILKPEVLSAVAVAGTALTTANKGLGIATVARGLAEQAGQVATTAAKVGGEAFGKATTALGKIIGLAGTVASILTVIATLATIAMVAVLMKRIDGLESLIDSVATTAQKALEVGFRSLSQSGLALSKSEVAIKEANLAREIANVALKQSDQALAQAAVAIQESNKAIEKANKAIKDADLALGRANVAIQNANEALVKADAAIKRANAVAADLAAFKKEVEFKYQALATLLFRALNNALGDIYATLDIHSDAIYRLDSGMRQAIAEANAATAKANQAANQANAATAKANNAIAQANSTAQQLPPVANTANNANTQSAEAVRILKDGVRTIYNPKVYEPTITNAVTRTVQAIVPISIADAKADTKRQVDAIKSNIQSQYQTGQKQIQDLRDRVIQLAPTGVGTINETKVRDIVASTPIVRDTANAIAGIQPRVRDLETDNARVIPQVRDLQRDLEGNDVANQNIERKLDALIPAVTAIPAAVGTLIIPRLLTPDRAGEVVRTNVCQLTRPGGCLGNPLEGLRRGQGGLLDALNTGANAAQSALLLRVDQTVTRIDTKIGSTSIAGGLSGGIRRFMESQIVDRVLSLVTAAAAFHNVMMLSNSIQSTFFEILDNLFTIPALITNPDGANVDTRETVTNFLNSYFAKLFGAAEWTAIKAQWKAYSTIYSSVAQGFDNLREIHSDSQELLNMARNYTAQLGNALVDEGLISEDNWEYKDPDQKIKSKAISRLDRMGRGLEAVDESLQALEEVTSTLLNITQTANEIKENVDAINKGVSDANKAAKADREAKIEGIDLPNFSLDDLF